MILSCPACATRYVLDPASLGADGRKVRCARCGETWYQDPPIEAPKLALVDPEPPADIPVTPPAMVGGGTAVPVEERMPSFFAEPPRPIGSNLPALAQPKRRLGTVGLGWIGLGLFIALTLAAGWYFAPSVMARWPNATRLYAVLGLADLPADYGLELRDTASARGSDESGPTVVVTGEIANIADRPRPLPKLRLILRNAKGEALKSQDFPPPSDLLKPGESVPYQAAIPAPDNPDDAASALVAFVTR
jgi:predicted Zn finger-like uncharacterized protein